METGSQQERSAVGAWRLRTDHLGRQPWQGEAPSATSAAAPWHGRDRLSGAGSGRRRRAACDARATGGGMHASVRAAADGEAEPWPAEGTIGFVSIRDCPGLQLNG